jgi:hypothetical protein
MGMRIFTPKEEILGDNRRAVDLSGPAGAWEERIQPGDLLDGTILTHRPHSDLLPHVVAAFVKQGTPGHPQSPIGGAKSDLHLPSGNPSGTTGRLRIRDEFAWAWFPFREQRRSRDAAPIGKNDLKNLACQCNGPFRLLVANGPRLEALGRQGPRLRQNGVAHSDVLALALEPRGPGV